MKAAHNPRTRAGYREAPSPAPDAFQIRHAFIKRYEPTNSYQRANEAHKEMGRAAQVVFRLKAKTIRGAIAKLRLAIKLIDADEIDTWQGDKDWLAETLADFERLAR